MPMLVSKKLRHLEYYDLQRTFDELYEKSQKGHKFSNLFEIIASDENIKLAYRNIKRNKGSKTAGVDGLTIKNVKKLSEEKFLEIIKKKLAWYSPKAVKRVEIPKPDGRKRPLGIPTIMDRIVQQCILQVLEPICEAKFHERSNGFRPNRSAEHAIAQCYKMIQQQNLHFAVDIDIKGFFDNVDHAKLIKQMWNMGICDKKLLCIVKEMLKAPIVLPIGEKIYPTKGTPQGGILSPLLSNIVLNELDWWIASQWEDIPTRTKYKCFTHKNGSLNKSAIYVQIRKTNLKEMFIVRYADDFKIFCRKRSDAIKIFEAVKMWLKERLNLEVSEEKSKIVNLKKNYSEFLGFKLKAIKKGKRYIVKSHMTDSAVKKAEEKLIARIKEIRKSGVAEEKEALAINYYNATVWGIHNYYGIATCISLDCQKIRRRIRLVMYNRLRNKIVKTGSISNKYINNVYGKSAQVRYINDKPLCPIGYIRTKHPMFKKTVINKYTEDGRKEIHETLGVNLKVLHELMDQHVICKSIEYMDTRMSIYCAQKGKCAVTGKILEIEEINCHHKVPKKLGGDDDYRNLIIIHSDVHKLIHAKTTEIIEKYFNRLNLTKEMLMKINNLRKLAQREEI
ncbi:MAG: group II intron reverse transcriptase/maturase [Acutalibacteraceae bacterium]|jgi:RNA-directed DNA polymerase